MFSLYVEANGISWFVRIVIITKVTDKSCTTGTSINVRRKYIFIIISYSWNNFFGWELPIRKIAWSWTGWDRYLLQFTHNNSLGLLWYIHLWENLNRKRYKRTHLRRQSWFFQIGQGGKFKMEDSRSRNLVILFTFLKILAGLVLHIIITWSLDWLD